MISLVESISPLIEEHKLIYILAVMTQEVLQQTPTSMPPQHISSTLKTPAWGRKCVLAIKSMSTITDDMGRTSRENKEINYDLVNSIFREGDFDHVLNPFGFNMSKYGGTPTKMQNYNIIRSRLETLRGEEMNSPLNFFVFAISGEAVSAKKQMRKEMLKDLMKAHVRIEFQLDEQITQLEEQMAELQSQIESAQDQQQMQQMQQQMQEMQQQRNNMPDIVAEMKKFNSEYVDPTEQTNNKILKYLKRKDQLALKFNLGWFHALVSAEEVYYTGITRGHPSVRPVNPLQLDYDKGANTTFIHEGNWVKEEYWLPIGECIAQFGDVLSDAQVKQISSGQAGHSIMQGGMQQGFAYSFDGGQRRSHTANGASSHVYVMQTAWRSFAKVGMLSYKDPRSGKWEETEVDDTFKMTPELQEMEAILEWEWDSEIWEGTLIGNDIFVNVRVKNNQTKNLPYVGYIYNNVNSIATSMVDLTKSHQYTYIIVWWRLEQELAKAKGKKFVMDMAQLPKSMGWDVDKWMYYFENLGVVWINSREEGRKGDPSSVANFNQFQSIDMTLSEVVGQYMEVIRKLEMLVEDIMGVSPQRMGDIGGQETATGAQTAISRSTNVTKPWFYFHDLVKEAVLTELLELAKIAYIDGAEMELVLDETEVQTLVVDGDKLNGSQMGVFVSNSFEDRQKKEKMESLITMAVQQGKASLLDIANVLESDSMNYMKTKLEEGERKAQEAANASSQADQEAKAAALEQERKEKELDRAQELDIATRNIAKDILVKKMDIGAKELSSDNGDMKAVEAFTKVTLEEDKLAFEKTKEANRVAEAKQLLAIKEKEAKAKETAAKNKSTVK
jgi:hypothetical protein